jgi:hypothetical protein
VIDAFAPEELVVVREDGPVDVELRVLPQMKPATDVAVFALSTAITPELDLHPTSEGAVFSQDAYFLGFPYGLGLESANLTYPFVKKAIFSGQKTEPDGAHVWFLDGINNPGFSGGPVVFKQGGSDSWHVAAVVSGYRAEHVGVHGGEGAVPVNTGIIVAHDIAAAVEAIDHSAGCA